MTMKLDHLSRDRPTGHREEHSVERVLASVAGGAKHGYGMIEDIAGFSGVRFEPGTLYGRRHSRLATSARVRRATPRGARVPVLKRTYAKCHRGRSAGSTLATGSAGAASTLGRNLDRERMIDRAEVHFADVAD